MTAAQRSAFIKYLEDSMPYVLQLLLAYLQRSGANSDEHLKVRVHAHHTHNTHNIHNTLHTFDSPTCTHTWGHTRKPATQSTA